MYAREKHVFARYFRRALTSFDSSIHFVIVHKTNGKEHSLLRIPFLSLKIILGIDRYINQIMSVYIVTSIR